MTPNKSIYRVTLSHRSGVILRDVYATTKHGAMKTAQLAERVLGNKTKLTPISADFICEVGTQTPTLFNSHGPEPERGSRRNVRAE